eukprot:CAMPEP_0202960656 /NCGR_PEP_ID=MMETSP1396-20130829/4807_1 /ASSEMBLY_ACC=CAM_ASM_000872 /TAXON_ID= /ORGANISM="Pseudokeronopsis sp., Strain Brazil" /LENGTH=101 /DNA_ID=CAMNT_0049680019 /DNA_START=36 /DNA_END=341 /DNA_ORIENTATION=-
MKEKLDRKMASARGKKQHDKLINTLQSQSKIIQQSQIAQALHDQSDDFDARSGIYYYEVNAAADSIIKKQKDPAEEKRGPAYYSPKFDSIKNPKSFNIKLS